MDFSIALSDLGRDTAFQIINQARPSSDYLFNTLLPERNVQNYYVDAANMVIRTTAAGLAGESSPYPPGGAITASQFLEKTAKIALSSTFEESALKQIQDILARAGANSSGNKNFLVNEALNWYNKVIVQGLMDRDEMLRARSLIDGAISWKFNDKTIDVDYGVPSANKPAKKTSTAAYDKSASTFWTDYATAIAALRYNIRAVIMNTTTWNAIISNDANNILVTAQTPNTASFTKLVTAGSGVIPSSDARQRVNVILYDNEYEELDPSDTATTVRKPFVETGEILIVANNNSNGYVVGEGATPDPAASAALGYHHMAPTVEGNGAAGRWGRIYVPEGEPWAIRAQGAENSLPVRTDVTATSAKTFTLKTQIAGA